MRPSDPASPSLAPEYLLQRAHEILGQLQGDNAIVYIDHVATSITRVANDRVRLTNDGDDLTVEMRVGIGQRRAVWLTINQLDPDNVARAVDYLHRSMREQEGDPASITVPWRPRTYLPNTTWHPNTATALASAPAEIVPRLTGPVLDAGFGVSAFVGVRAFSSAMASTYGRSVSGHETDVEVTVTGWTEDQKGSGWAGRATRDWASLDPSAVAQEAVRLTTLSRNPVAFEPGRRLTILGRPAMAQIMYLMAHDIDMLDSVTPLFNQAGQPRFGERVLDARIDITSDPRDPDGGYLPFSRNGDPMVPGRWIERGVLRDLPVIPGNAAVMGFPNGQPLPHSIRMSGGTTTIDEMIANCKEGIYVNRLAALEKVDSHTGMMTGVTNGGCFVVRHGKIDKPIRDLRFLDSPYFFLNRLEAIGPTARAPFGYSPTQGDEWPLAPTIVPPVMVQDFNFIALADAV